MRVAVPEATGLSRTVRDWKQRWSSFYREGAALPHGILACAVPTLRNAFIGKEVKIFEAFPPS